MKRVQREVYGALTDEIGYCLCSFCRYARFSGDCEYGDIDCNHQIERVRDFELEKASTMGDCWGFSPKRPLADIADIVGIILAQGWNGGATWWEEGDQLKVAGRKFE